MGGLCSLNIPNLNNVQVRNVLNGPKLAAIEFRAIAYTGCATWSSNGSIGFTAHMFTKAMSVATLNKVDVISMISAHYYTCPSPDQSG